MKHTYTDLICLVQSPMSISAMFWTLSIELGYASDVLGRSDFGNRGHDYKCSNRRGFAPTKVTKENRIPNPTRLLAVRLRFMPALFRRNPTMAGFLFGMSEQCGRCLVSRLYCRQFDSSRRPTTHMVSKTFQGSLSSASKGVVAPPMVRNKNRCSGAESFDARMVTKMRKQVSWQLSMKKEDTNFKAIAFINKSATLFSKRSWIK